MSQDTPTLALSSGLAHAMFPPTFEEQALPHLPALRAAARRFTASDRDDADDLVQDTLVLAMLGWHRFRPVTNCRAWLLRILSNCYISAYRRRVRERRLLADGDPFGSDQQTNAARDPESALIEALHTAQITEAIARLPPGFSEVLVMADVQGLRYREIAAQLGCPIGTVMSRLHRARRQLAIDLGLITAPGTQVAA